MGARYGQHFLHDPRAIATILDRFDARPGDRVVEIGPGRGALTTLLTARVRALAAVEIDPDLARRLASSLPLRLVRHEPRRTPSFTLVDDASIDAQGVEATASNDAEARPDPRPAAVDEGPGRARSGADRRRRLLHARTRPVSADTPLAAGDDAARGDSHALGFVVLADALTVSYEDLARLLEAVGSERLRVIGNLPYGVATALVQRMIGARNRVADATIMVQKEVADRLLAGPGGKEYGFLSVVLALCSERARLMTLGPGAFSPAPRVRSSVISLRFPAPAPGFAASDARLSAIVKAAFAERRKRAASNLARALTIDRATVERVMGECGIDPGARAEAIAPGAFARLAERLPAP